MRDHLIASMLLPIALAAVSCSGHGMTLTAVGYVLLEPPPERAGQYKTYTLFLGTSPKNSDDPDLERLQQDFERFGDEIGDDNLAIWVQEEGLPGFSASKGQFYTKLYNSAYRRGTGGVARDKPLVPSDGPFVIMADCAPDEWKPGQAAHVKSCSLALMFRDRTIPGMSKVLSCLGSCIHASHDICADIAACQRCGVQVLPATIGGAMARQ